MFRDSFQDSRPAAAPQKANPRVHILNDSATGRELLLLKETFLMGEFLSAHSVLTV